MASVWSTEISTISNFEQNVSYIEQMFQIVNKSRYDSQPNKLWAVHSNKRYNSGFEWSISYFMIWCTISNLWFIIYQSSLIIYDINKQRLAKSCFTYSLASVWIRLGRHNSRCASRRETEFTGRGAHFQQLSVDVQFVKNTPSLPMLWQ